MTFEQAVQTAFPNTCPCCWAIGSVPDADGAIAVYPGFTTLSNLTGIPVETLVRRIEYNLLRNYCGSYLDALRGGHRAPRLEIRNGYVLHGRETRLQMETGEYLTEMPVLAAFTTPIPGESEVSNPADHAEAYRRLAQRRDRVLQRALDERRKQIEEIERKLAWLRCDAAAMERESRQCEMQIAETRSKPQG